MGTEVHFTAWGLQGFYEAPLGAVTRRVLRARLRAVWPELSGREVLGLGHAGPYLRLWRRGAARLVSATPAALAAGHRAAPRIAPWPADGLCAAALTEEDRLPFADLAFDNILLVHGLEAAENARRLLREAWRVLRPEGRLLAVVPNRRSVWAHLEHTPFGHGQPYSPGQLARLLERSMFAVERREAALFIPPFTPRPLLGGARLWEAAGRALAPQLGGVTVIEARKSVMGMIPAGARPVRARLARAPQPGWAVAEEACASAARSPGPADSAPAHPAARGGGPSRTDMMTNPLPLAAALLALGGALAGPALAQGGTAPGATAPGPAAPPPMVAAPGTTIPGQGTVLPPGSPIPPGMVQTGTVMVPGPLPAQAPQGNTRVGQLQCDVSGGVSYVFGSTRALSCQFRPVNGPAEPYAGEIRRFGLDIGFSGRGTMVWTVLNVGTDIAPGSLAGTYGGASSNASLGLGLGSAALIGGSRDQVALQPLVIETSTGVNLAVGIAELTLRAGG